MKLKFPKEINASYKKIPPGEKLFWLIYLIIILCLGLHLGLFVHSLVISLMITLGIVSLESSERAVVLTSVTLLFAIFGIFYQNKQLQTQIESYRPYIGIKNFPGLQQNSIELEKMAVPIEFKNYGKAPAFNVTFSGDLYSEKAYTKERINTSRDYFPLAPPTTVFPDSTMYYTITIPVKVCQQIKIDRDNNIAWHIIIKAKYESSSGKIHQTICDQFYDSLYNRFEPNGCTIK
ncbi:MAG TPA: hypothetical protein PLO85_06595 [Candidatus Omnitrophota bacterium]|nr:hypothetical protein [Candidatus Omnitrophota bacterium]